MTGLIQSAFSSQRGVILANKLVAYMSESEDVINWDECIAAICEELSEVIDRKSQYPVSKFFASELKQKLSVYTRSGRYKVSLNVDGLA
jgi:hypothetical protein